MDADALVNEWGRRAVLASSRGKQIQSEVTVLEVEFVGGRDVQIGDMTWDYEDAHVVVRYKTKARPATYVVVHKDFPQVLAECLAIEREEQ